MLSFECPAQQLSSPIKDGGEFLVNTTTAKGQYDPSITGLADGRFVALWSDYSSSGGGTTTSDVRGQIFSADGRSQGPEFLVNTTTRNDQFEHVIVPLADGGFVVAWSDNSQIFNSSTVYQVRAQIFTADGVKQGKEIPVSTATSGNQSDATITVLDDGSFVVTWTSYAILSGSVDSSASSLRGQIFTADGQKLGAEFLVNTTTTNLQFQSTITALAGGRFVVAWTDNSESNDDPSDYAVRAQIFTADGQRLGAEFLVNTTTTNRQYEPSITALSDGHFVVVWTDTSGSSDDSSGYAVRAQIFTGEGQRLGSEFLVNTTTSGFQFQPTVTALADARFVVAWTDTSGSSDDDSDYAVRAQIFGADGSRDGAEFLVNTITRFSQYEPAITAMADGRFVVAWTDGSRLGGDSSSLAVRAQIFDGRTAPIQLRGTAAADDFVGTAYGDRITGLSGNDLLSGRGGSDRLSGGFGNDQLLGGDGNDRLEGGRGRDILTAGAGRDTLSGGASADLFRYSTAAEVGLNNRRDVITDFTPGSDRLDLRGIDADTTRRRNQSFVFIGRRAFSAAGQLRYEKATGLLSADTNGDRIADFQLQLSNTPTLLATDILL